MFPIVKMCAWLGVSTSGFYDWLNRSASATAQRRTHLAGLVQAIFEESDSTYGYRRVHAALVRQGDGCGPEQVVPAPVPRRAFGPPPQVDSAVLVVRRR